MSLLERSTHFVIRLSNRGCTNRPFYHIVVMRNRQPSTAKVRDQIGTYDPMPNTHNEKLVALDYDRLRFWLSRNAHLSDAMKGLLGLSGYYPIHPQTRLTAFRNQRKAEQEAFAAQNEQTSEDDKS
ncbi:37S ribosomal protein S16 [Mactra antiquata]